MKIAETKGGRWFHDDMIGRFYFKNKEDYPNRQSYLSICHICSQYIYPDDKVRTVIYSRLGTTEIHESCGNLPL